MEDLIKNFLEYKLFENNILYKDFCFKIKDKNLIELTNEILSKLLNKNENNNNTKYFLNLFLINYYENDFFNYSASKRYSLIASSNILINSFKKLIMEYNKEYKIIIKIFKEDYENYLNNYNEWYIENKFFIINDYIYLYIQTLGNINILEKEENLEYKENSLFFIKFFKKNIKKNATLLCPEFSSYVKEFTILPKKIIFNKKLMVLAKDDYFQYLKKKIKNKKFNKLKDFLKIFIQRFKSIDPNITNDNINLIDEYFNIEHIINLLQNNELNEDFIGKLAKFLLKQIFKYQDPNYDESHNIWKENFYKNLVKIDIHYSFLNLLKYGITKIEQIEKDIKIYFSTENI